MSLTPADKKWHDVYETLRETDKHIGDVINDAFFDIRQGMASVGLKGACDDRAEQLVAMITRYVVESDPALKETYC